MHRKTAAIGLLCAGACLASAAQAKDLTGWFVNGGVGTANYHATVDYDGYHASGNKSGGSVALLNFGWRSQFIGVEAGYTNLGSVTERAYGDRAKLSGDGWTLGLNGHFNPTRNWYVSARGGAFYSNLRSRLTVNDIGYGSARYSGTDRSLGWYAGVGTGYDIDWHWSIGASFDYYKINGDDYDIGSKVFTVSAEYRF